MTRAIYTAAKDGKVIAQRDALIWVRLTAPGMYARCGEGGGAGEADGEGVLIDGTIYHVRGCPILPGKETVTLDYIE